MSDPWGNSRSFCLSVQSLGRFRNVGCGGQQTSTCIEMATSWHIQPAVDMFQVYANPGYGVLMGLHAAAGGAARAAAGRGRGHERACDAAEAEGADRHPAPPRRPALRQASRRYYLTTPTLGVCAAWQRNVTCSYCDATMSPGENRSSLSGCFRSALRMLVSELCSRLAKGSKGCLAGEVIDSSLHATVIDCKSTRHVRATGAFSPPWLQTRECCNNISQEG